MVATIGADVPHLFGSIPYRRGDGGLENGKVVKIVLFGDQLTVSKNLRSLGIVARGHVAGLVEARQVIVGHDVAGRSRIAVPVPGTADVATPLDNTDALDAIFAQARRGQQGGKAAADKKAFHCVAYWFSRLDRAAVRIDFVLLHPSFKVGGVLPGAFRPVSQPQVTFLSELMLDRVVVLLRLPGPRT